MWTGVVRVGATRRISRYISQPRQNPKTALSSAAARAKPVAIAPTRVAPDEVADEADHREDEPDALGEARGLRVLEVRGGRETRPHQAS